MAVTYVDFLFWGRTAGQISQAINSRSQANTPLPDHLAVSSYIHQLMLSTPSLPQKFTSEHSLFIVSITHSYESTHSSPQVSVAQANIPRIIRSQRSIIRSFS